MPRRPKKREGSSVCVQPCALLLSLAPRASSNIKYRDQLPLRRSSRASLQSDVAPSSSLDEKTAPVTAYHHNVPLAHYSTHSLNNSRHAPKPPRDISREDARDKEDPKLGILTLQVQTKHPHKCPRLKYARLVEHVDHHWWPLMGNTRPTHRTTRGAQGKYDHPQDKDIRYVQNDDMRVMHRCHPTVGYLRTVTKNSRYAC